MLTRLPSDAVLALSRARKAKVTDDLVVTDHPSTESVYVWCEIQEEGVWIDYHELGALIEALQMLKDMWVQEKQADYSRDTKLEKIRARLK